jgi:hypothetical protein
MENNTDVSTGQSYLYIDLSVLVFFKKYSISSEVFLAQPRKKL